MRRQPKSLSGAGRITLLRALYLLPLGQPAEFSASLERLRTPRAFEGDRLMRAATQATSMLWVVALASLRGVISELSLAQLPASLIGFFGLALVSIAANRFRAQFAHDARIARKALVELSRGDWARGLHEFWGRARNLGLPMVGWPRVCPSDPGLILATVALAWAGLLRWRLRAPEAAAALAQRIERLLHSRLRRDLESVRAWLSAWLPAGFPGLALATTDGLPRPGALSRIRYRLTLFEPLSLPQRC